DDTETCCVTSLCIMGRTAVPLYQEYWLKALRADVHRVHHSGLAELVAPRCLPGLLAHQTPKIHSAAPRHLTEGVTCSLWQELPEVGIYGRYLSNIVLEIGVLQTMFELMASEASYLKSLSVAVNLFLTSKQLRKALTTVEHHILFSNLREVCRVSERFLLDLEVRLGESMVMSQVGDIVLRHHTELRQAYVPYVTNMMYQEALINQLMLKFVLYLRKLEKDPQCRRQTLKSFLVLPFQRITRLKLLLEVCYWFSVYYYYIASVVVMELFFFFLFLHPRRYLIHEGALKRLNIGGSPTVRSPSNFSNVYLHLFNDLLLVSSRKGRQYSVQDYALFPSNVSLECVRTDMLGLPAESFLLRLIRNHTGAPTAFILATRTR
uniref:DH domain-containing protein n=1 Tax=Denticeps clupeoides TaxID=299321 RepID=A0AAY4C3T4_9TELE